MNIQICEEIIYDCERWSFSNCLLGLILYIRIITSNQKYHTFLNRGRHSDNIHGLFIIIFCKCVLCCVSDGTPKGTRLWMNGFPSRPDDKQSTLSRYVQWHHT